jgi:TRAP-type C4-dicarboxylate transport system permease small subunit
MKWGLSIVNLLMYLAFSLLILWGIQWSLNWLVYSVDGNVQQFITYKQTLVAWLLVRFVWMLVAVDQASRKSDAKN